jgi:hypothetical protein
MSPEQQANNIASWNDLAASIEEHPEDAFWTPWKMLARRFVGEGIEVGLNRNFRAGRGMNHFIFSTLDHHGLRLEPRVTVELHPKSKLRIAYGTNNLYLFSPELEYTLEYIPAFVTFRQFLNHLWTETVTDPHPEELRGFSAPILTQFTE